MILIKTYFMFSNQLGTMRALLKEGIDISKALDILWDIEENQFIGSVPNPYEDYEIVIAKKKD